VVVFVDLKEKLAIFEKYDFSKSALIQRAGIDYHSQKSNLYHGIANKIQIMITNIAIIASGKLENIQEYREIEDKVFKDYGWLQVKYQGIDWNELDYDDFDFAVFFEMKTLLDDLSRDIDTFLNKSRLEFKLNTMDSKEYREIKQKIEHSNQLMQKFKETKERLQKEKDSSSRQTLEKRPGSSALTG
jgi:hypothetical protein